jgi:hypothetical protein
MTLCLIFLCFRLVCFVQNEFLGITFQQLWTIVIVFEGNSIIINSSFSYLSVTNSIKKHVIQKTGKRGISRE